MKATSRSLLLPVLALCAVFGLGPKAFGQESDVGTLAYVPSAERVGGLQGFVRVVNESTSPATVAITGYDDTGRRFGPVNLSLAASSSVRLLSEHLERGSAADGLPVGLGNGTGDWRLELRGPPEVGAVALVRTPDQFMTSLQAVVEPETAGATVYSVATFNPGSNTAKASALRLVNPGNASAAVTITGIDDRGASGPGGNVRLTVPAGGAVRVTAAELEAGRSGLRGRLGDGAGKWRLRVSSDRPLLVMNLLFSLTDSGLLYVSNLSVGGAAAESSSGRSVLPLDPIRLRLTSGEWQGNERIQMDLSGTGTFPAADTVEIAPVIHSANQAQVAAPLVQALPARNTGREIAIRAVFGDGRPSAPLRYRLRDVPVPAAHAGVPSNMLEVLLKAVYESSDDPLLNLEASSIQPGTLWAASHRLGVDTAVGDAQADALLRLLTGYTVAGVAAGAPVAPAGRTAMAMIAPDGGVSWAASAKAARPLFTGAREGLRRGLECINGSMTRFVQGRETQFDRDGRCAGIFARDYVTGWVDDGLSILSLTGAGRTLRRVIPKVIRKAGISAVESEIEKGLRNVGIPEGAIRIGKLARGLTSFPPNDPGGVVDFARNAAGAYVATKRGLRGVYADLQGMARDAAERSGGLVAAAEREYTSRRRTNAERAAFAALQERNDNWHDEAATMAALESVHTGDQAPAEGIAALPNDSGDTRSGTSCEGGYEEFRLDDETSTCVWASLVEPNCYAGSRPASGVDLGDSDACLYYSLDFFQAGGTCRENYARVTYRGRQTCRWAELGASKLEWYTLHKSGEEPEPPQPPPPGGREWCCYTTDYRHFSSDLSSCNCFDDDYSVSIFFESCEDRVEDHQRSFPYTVVTRVAACGSPVGRGGSEQQWVCEDWHEGTIYAKCECEWIYSIYSPPCTGLNGPVDGCTVVDSCPSGGSRLRSGPAIPGLDEIFNGASSRVSGDTESLLDRLGGSGAIR